MNRSRREAEAELIARGWSLDLDAHEWHHEASDQVVLFLNYPIINIFERTYMGPFKGTLTTVEMGLFVDWLNGWYYETGSTDRY